MGASSVQPPHEVLVTGAGGRLGTALVDRLLACGHRVRGLYRSADGAERARPEVEVHVADLFDQRGLLRAMRGATGLVHGAACLGRGRESRAAVRAGTVEGTSAVLRAARRCKVDRIVHISSIFAVGLTREPVTIGPGHQWSYNEQPRVEYVLAKREAEERALEATRHGLPLTVVSPGALVDGASGAPRRTSTTELARAARAVEAALLAGPIGERRVVAEVPATAAAIGAGRLAGRLARLRPRFDPVRYEVSGWFCLVDGDS